MGEISVALREVRGLINEPRTQSVLLQDVSRWNRLCASLDAVEDTQACIEAFPGDTLNDLGLRYLCIYGLLQALYVQQDAVENLAKGLGSDYTRDDALNEVRRTRNDATGHPTGRSNGSFVFIQQISVSPRGFKLMTTFADGRPAKFTTVDLSHLLNAQRSSVLAALRTFSDGLRTRQRAHREEYRTVSLASLLPSTWSYSVEKIFEAIHRSELRELGLVHAQALGDGLGTLKGELAKRGLLEAYDGLAKEIEKLEWPLGELCRFFSAKPCTLIDARLAEIVAHYCSESLGALARTAKDLDKEYSEE